MRFNTIQEAVEDLKQGKMIILVDDANRENEGDITVAAEKLRQRLLILCLLMRENHLPCNQCRTGRRA